LHIVAIIIVIVIIATYNNNIDLKADKVNDSTKAI